MDQNSGTGAGNGMRGSEDASEATEHVRNVEENREALEAQSRRVEGSTPADVAGRPIRGLDESRGASEDASRAAAHARNAEENRDALEAQNRRVESTAPEGTRDDLRDR